MRIFKLLFAAAGATVVLGALTPSAFARNFSYESQTWRAAYRELNFIAMGRTSCQVTLEGSFNARTIPKVNGSLVGYITTATLGPCTSGTATILSETLPWHYRISGFTGNLPDITSIIYHVVNFSVRVREAGGITCLARSSTAEPVVQQAHRDPVTSSITGLSNTGRIRTGAECLGISGEITSDNPTPTIPGTTAGFHVRLI